MTLQRIDNEVSESVKFVKRWLLLTKKNRFDFSDTVGYVFQKFIEQNNIIKKTNITELDIKVNDKILKDSRIDTNLPSDVRDDIKIIQYVINKDKKDNEKRITMDEVIRSAVAIYMDLFPDIKQIKMEDKYILQKIHIDEMRRNKRGY